MRTRFTVAAVGLAWFGWRLMACGYDYDALKGTAGNQGGHGPVLGGGGGIAVQVPGAAGAAGQPASGGRGSLGTGGATGGRTGTAGTGGSGAGPGAGGAGGTSTGGGAGGSGGGVGAGGTAGMGSGGVTGAGGTSTGGVAGGTAGQGGAGGLAQLIVSIDFIGGRPSTGGSAGASLTGPPVMAASETAGIKPATNWNGAPSITGTLANLRASDGSVTSATVTWNSPATWTNLFTDAPGDVRMMNGYLDPASSASPATVKVSGLPAAITGSYDVYVYGYGEIPDTSTRNYQYTIGTSTFTMSQTGPSTPFSGFAQAASGGAGDYFVFRRVSGATFTLTAAPGTGSPSRAPINGLQVVWPSGS